VAVSLRTFGLTNERTSPLYRMACDPGPAGGCQRVVESGWC
jgi:hypothetical protein